MRRTEEEEEEEKEKEEKDTPMMAVRWCHRRSRDSD